MIWSPLPYPGAKTGGVRPLRAIMPQDVKLVVSAFCGGCSLEIALAMSGILVLAFDKLAKLVNFWNVLKDSPDLLTDRVQLIYREFGKDCFLRLQRVSGSFNRINRAASYYAIKRSQFNGAESGGYTVRKARSAESSIRLIQKFQWPQLLTVELQDFRDTLMKYPFDYLFLDPPYYLPSNLYGYRGVDWCHEEFAALLRCHKGRFLLCYNDDPYVRSLYSDYLILEASHLWKYGANKSKQASEIFILNYEPTREQLVAAGFNPSGTACKPSGAVSWDHQRRVYVIGSLEPVIPPEPNAIILQGDCNDTLKLIESESVNLIVTSPPYNLRKRYGTTREPRRSLGEYLGEIAPVAEELYRILGPKGSLCWQVGNYVEAGEVFPLDIYFYQMLKRLGLILRNRIVWHFGAGLHATKRFSGRYETILWFSKTDDYIFDLDAVRIPAKYPGKKHFKGSRRGQLSCNPLGKNPSDYWDLGTVLRHDWEELVWKVPNLKANHPEKTEHPCQFPIELVQRLVLALTREDDYVLDPFGGVGSSMIAAVSLGRNAIMCEIEDRYIEIAGQRLEAYRNGTLRIRPLGKPIYEPTEGGK